MKVLSLLLACVFTIGAFAPTAEAAPKKMVAVILLMDDGDDKQIVTTIYTSLMAAEKVAKTLEIEMTSDDEVNDDVFVFSLKSQDQKELAMQMFDEEGYEIAADRVLKVTEGNNYNALNVKTLDDGTYIFKIQDESGAEMTKKISINRD
ncbi:MAG: T9SS type A sorting domain-containing protein [Aureispira sp.]|nr:T9SS type A sorting domain-containing protein [Aureispira sp.]